MIGWVRSGCFFSHKGMSSRGKCLSSFCWSLSWEAGWTLWSFGTIAFDGTIGFQLTSDQSQHIVADYIISIWWYDPSDLFTTCEPLKVFKRACPHLTFCICAGCRLWCAYAWIKGGDGRPWLKGIAGIERKLDGGSNDFAFPSENDSIWWIVESTTILKACFVSEVATVVRCLCDEIESADEEK